MSDIAVPSTAKQIQAQKILHEYRNTVLGNSLKRTVSKIEPKVLHAEIVSYVSSESMRVLQACSVREEIVFALPCIIKENPKLLGYYRLLMGISEKQFYTSGSGLSSFKALEHDGRIDTHTDSEIAELCKAINSAMDIFLKNAKKENLSLDLYDLPLMTLGVYVDGVWRNVIGQQAALHVFDAIKELLRKTHAVIEEDKDKSFVFKNSEGKVFRISPSSDPDIAIVEEGAQPSKVLCIEIKGGQDVANVHNRAGEAEKSHQKAIKEGWKEKWTVIYLAGLREDQRNKLSMESPSTDKWFDVNEICARSGETFEDFKNQLYDRFRVTDSHV